MMRLHQSGPRLRCLRVPTAHRLDRNLAQIRQTAAHVRDLRFDPQPSDSFKAVRALASAASTDRDGSIWPELCDNSSPAVGRSATANPASNKRDGTRHVEKQSDPG